MIFLFYCKKVRLLILILFFSLLISYKIEKMLMQEEIQVKGDSSSYSNDDKSITLVQTEKKDSIIEKSLDKLKETSTV